MDSKKLIGENEINVELTEKLNQDPKYNLFKTWLKSKGARWKDVDFPVAFGPAGVVGVAASQDIPSCSAIFCIPNEILITTTKVQNGELASFVNAFPELFDDHEDAEFNLLATFLVREKIKGKESDFEPLVNVISNDAILLHWEKETIEEIEDPYIKKEAVEFEKEMNQVWDAFKVAYDKFPQFFPPGSVTKQIFFWAYEAVMTRCFGWSLPNTMIVPLADFMNHNPDGTTHYMVNTKFEKLDCEVPPTYVLKKRKVDLTIFEDETLVLPEDEKKMYYVASQERINYVRTHIDFLSKVNRSKFEQDNYRKEEIKKWVREINLTLLKKDSNRQAWEVQWFESSDDEDNDTDEEEDDDEEEEGKKTGVDGKATFETLNKQETEKLNEKRKELVYEETKKDYKPDEEDGDDEYEDVDSEEEEDEEEEENEELKKARDEYKFGKGILTENFDPSKYMKLGVSEYEKEEMKKMKKEEEAGQSPKKTPKKADDENNEEGDDGDESDDSNWDWFEDSDRNNYFVVSTHSHLQYKKGDQIFNCYGRRTNRFLLMWYGFCLQNNRYNSLSFRLWMNKTSLSNSSPPKKILFKDYITEKEWVEKEVGEEKSSPQELTKEFRVKYGSFCQDVLAYLRAQLLLTYKGPDLQRILVTIPTSIPYEEFVIDYAISLFIEIKNQYKTSIYEDEELLKDLTMHYRKRFAIVYRLEQKRIADLQIRLLRILQHIILRLKAGAFFKDAYMEKLPDIEGSDDEFIENRRRLSGYLKLFYQNYTL